MKKVLITGAAGFIAFHLSQKLLSLGYNVVGLDNFNDYYDTNLKYARADILNKKGIDIYRADLCDTDQLSEVFEKEQPDLVVHLAAYAGVRHSLEYPMKYIQNNIVGTQNLISICEEYNVSKVIYASTSCVMSGDELPWKEDRPTKMQLNAYGYSKRTNECQFATSKIKNTIGLRFFTVYGPWGRPDMALFTFTKNTLEGKPIDVYNYGNMKRDFTYVDDIVQGINLVSERIIGIDKSMHEVYNIGYGKQINLMDFISEIETNVGQKATLNFLPMHPADTQETWSDTTKLQGLGYSPTTPVKVGIKNFVSWYKTYYGWN
jgi:UDP-glucuronate 4-epimerase